MAQNEEVTILNIKLGRLNYKTLLTKNIEVKSLKNHIYL